MEKENGFDTYTKLLTQLGKADLPLAARGTLNDMAYHTRTNMADVQLNKKFQIRNRFEQKSIRFNKAANTFEINKMETGAGQIDTTNFKKSKNAPLDDLAKQEIGGVEKARPGSKFRRTPTKHARKGRSAGGVVSARNRPSKGANWLKMSDIHRNMGMTRVPSNKKKAARQVMAIMYRSRKMKGARAMFILPSVKDPSRKMNVFRAEGDRIQLIHVLDKAPKKLKKRKTLSPAIDHTLSIAGDIWVKNVETRIDRAVAKAVGL